MSVWKLVLSLGLKGGGRELPLVFLASNNVAGDGTVGSSLGRKEGDGAKSGCEKHDGLTGCLFVGYCNNLKNRGILVARKRKRTRSIQEVVRTCIL